MSETTLTVRVNPYKKVNGRPLRVLNPLRKAPFPNEKNIVLKQAELNDPVIIRLLPPIGAPGGVVAGRDADLIPVDVLDSYAPAKDKTAKTKTPK